MDIAANGVKVSLGIPEFGKSFGQLDKPLAMDGFLFPFGAYREVLSLCGAK